MHCNVLRNYARLYHFNYDKHGTDWNVHVGREQSPIPLAKSKAVRSTAPRLAFVNYDKIFAVPLKITNNGHTITMDIPPVENGLHPSVCGCKLKCVYKAVELHFHWGSPRSRGSEHTIDSSRHDAELHIVHQNSAYTLKKEAILSRDGFVVLAVMLKLVPNPTIDPHALNQIWHNTRQVTDFNKTSTFNGDFALRDILLGIDRKEFFSYKGSLTTPPCSEVVNWFIFPKPIEVSKRNLGNLWLLKDSRGKPLINNYRHLQKLHGRQVYYRKLFASKMKTMNSL